MATNSKVTALRTAKAAKAGSKPPSHLKAPGKNLWSHVSETFELEGHDSVLLQSWCETLDRKNQAEKDLRKHRSLTFTNRHGELKPHPAVAIIRDCNVLMARLRRELALSEDDPPDSRPPGLRYGGPK
jgi:P27 family predicted phage terminase small subunit